MIIKCKMCGGDLRIEEGTTGTSVNRFFVTA